MSEIIESIKEAREDMERADKKYYQLKDEAERKIISILKNAGFANVEIGRNARWSDVTNEICVIININPNFLISDEQKDSKKDVQINLEGKPLKLSKTIKSP